MRKHVGKEFAKMITDISNELGTSFFENQVIRFLDEHYDQAWSKAFDRFNHVICDYHDLVSRGLSDQEIEKVVLDEISLYRNAMVEFIRVYQTTQNQTQVNLFLDYKPGVDESQSLASQELERCISESVMNDFFDQITGAAPEAS